MHDQYAQRPRQGFGDHIVAVVEQPGTHAEGARDVALAALGAHVQRHGRHQRGASPPAIGPAGPLVDEAVVDLAGAPRRAGDQDAELIDVTPGCQAASEAVDRRRADQGSRARMKEDELIRDPSGG